MYSWEPEREREREAERHKQREKQAPCREPNARLEPGTPGPWPGPKTGTQPLSHPGIPQTLPFFFLKILFIYSWETQAEGEAGSMQGARLGTRSRASRITPRAAGVAKPLSHQGCPGTHNFGAFISYINVEVMFIYFVFVNLYSNYALWNIFLTRPLNLQERQRLKTL